MKEDKIKTNKRPDNPRQEDENEEESDWLEQSGFSSLNK